MPKAKVKLIDLFDNDGPPKDWRPKVGDTLALLLGLRAIRVKVTKEFSMSHYSGGTIDGWRCEWGKFNVTAGINSLRPIPIGRKVVKGAKPCRK